MNTSSTGQPFSNIKVIDLSHVIAGPFCTYQLAVLGAQVIKIEPPGDPDIVRDDCGRVEGRFERLGYLYSAQGGNKRAISVDLKDPAGKDIFNKLLADADVLVENYRSGALAKLGFDYATVKKTKPDIVYCSLTGFGQQGVDSGRNAYDNVMQAASGLMRANGTEESSPVKVGPPVLDYGTGIQAAFAIAAALFQRAGSGEGQYIDIAMQDAALMLMSSHVTHILEKGRPPELGGNSHHSNAGYGCYETGDGLIMIGAYNASQVRRLWQVLGDPRHGDEFTGLRPRDFGSFFERDKDRIAAIMKKKTAGEWESAFKKMRVPAARVRALDECLDDRQLESRDVIQCVPGQGARYPVAAYQFEHNGPKLQSAPPGFAQHTREVLVELGYNHDQIDALAMKGTIALADTDNP